MTRIYVWHVQDSPCPSTTHILPFTKRLSSALAESISNIRTHIVAHLQDFFKTSGIQRVTYSTPKHHTHPSSSHTHSRKTIRNRLAHIRFRAKRKRNECENASTASRIYAFRWECVPYVNIHHSVIVRAEFRSRLHVVCVIHLICWWRVCKCVRWMGWLRRAKVIQFAIHYTFATEGVLAHK